MSEKQTIEELVQKAQSGSTKAFGKPYDLLADRIYHYVLRKVGDKQKRLANPKTLCYSQMSRRLTFLTIGLLTTLLAALTFSSTARASWTPFNEEPFFNDELIILRHDRIEKIKVARDELPTRLTKLKSQADVIAVEPNYIATAQANPVNDPYFKYQWNFEQIKIPAAWEKSTGKNVVVAVVDSGVSRVKDLAKTKFVPGYDFVDDDSDPNDEFGHGTYVAGTIAQSTNNRYGTAGIAYGAKLMPVRVLDKNGSGSYFNIYQGIIWAVDNGANIINLSLGGPSDSKILREAVKYAYDNGVTVVAAAGNEGTEKILYPAAFDDYVLAVGAVRYDKQRASYSNAGSSLDFVAPGGDTSVDQNNDGYGDGILQQTLRGFYFYQGTSMAAAHASALAALLGAMKKQFLHSPALMRNALQETAEDLGASGWDKEYGWGLINAEAALQQEEKEDIEEPENMPVPTATPAEEAFTPTPTEGPTPTLTPYEEVLQRICARYPWWSRCGD